MSSERADTLHAALVEQVRSLRSSEEWIEAMVKAATFHQYSFGNWLLLAAQAEARGTTVTRPAGYRAWQKLGRNVKKGERGYQILAPLIRRTKRGNDDEPDGVIVTGFRAVTVFDVSQTEGDALPDVGPRQLEGIDSPDLFDAVVSLIEADGFSFELDELSGPNGTTSPLLRTVVVDSRLGSAQRAKTTVHELAHVRLHTDETIECRGRIEVEAESVAYIVCTASGLDTSTYSIPYVAGWAESTDDPIQTLLSTGETVVRAARTILDQLVTCNRNMVLG